MRGSVQPGIFDGDASAAGNFLRQRQIGRVEPPRRVAGGHERHRADDLSRRPDGHDHRAPDPEHAQRIAQRVVAHDGVEPFIGDLGVQERSVLTHGGGDAVIIVAAHAERRPVVPDPVRAVAIGVRHCECLDGAVVAAHVHRAPVGDARNRQVRHRLQRRRIVERLGERGADVGEEGRALRQFGAFELRPLAPRDIHADAGHSRRRAVGAVFDPAFALHPAHRPVGRHDPVFDLVRHAERHRARRRCHDTGLVVGVDLSFVALKRPVEGARRQPVDRGQIVRPDDLLRAEVPVPRAHPSGVERKAEARLVAAHGLVGPHAFDGKGDLLGNGQRERGFARVEHVRRSVVAHELAQHAVSHLQRNERQGANAFGAERGANGTRGPARARRRRRR